MNILTTQSFSAERQPNGEVWITSRNRNQKVWRDFGSQEMPSWLQDISTVKVPKEECETLAKLLCPDLIKYEKPDLNWKT